MSELATGPVGKVGSYEVKFEQGKLTASLNADAGIASAGVVLSVDSDHVIDALEKAIPGAIPQAILEVARAALKK